MTVSKESATARPVSQHRLSAGATASSLPSHKSRPHSHSISLGSINAAHRASRRKSMSSTAISNVAAMTMAMKAGSDSPQQAARRTSKAAFTPRGPGHYNGVPSSLPNNGATFGPFSYNGSMAKTSPTAIIDGPSLESLPENEKGNSKARIRRASEGSYLRKGEGKRVSGGELRCEKCGKGYKHSSCLTKHLWEHTPEWAITSKLLISKHQQVQLLEAASVLVQMNIDAAETSKDSDHSSASPAASGSSDPREDEISSTETTPPPHPDDVSGFFSPRGSNRFSVASSGYSRSYQSGNSVFSDSAPNGHGYMSHYRQWSTDGRPTTSGTSVAGSAYDDEEQADLAAAVGLLSCSYSTPKTGPVVLPPDVPPVPPLPAKFLDEASGTLSGSGSTLTAGHSSIPQREYSNFRHEARDIDMGDDDSLADDDDYRHSSRERLDEDEGVFGRMEE